MKIIISGGGTGGHIYPAIAIAQRLKEQNRNNEILFVGAKGKMEIQKVREAGFPIAQIWIDGFNRKNLFKNIFLPFKLLYSIWKSRKVIKYFKPDIVIGTGGYVSGPVLTSANKLKIPTVLLEQNAVPGVTNRILAKKADKVFVAYENAAKYFDKNKVEILGNPVRENITKSRITRKKALHYFGLDPSKKCILVLGGSLGARTINKSIEKNYKKIYKSDIQIIWQTGKYYYKKIIKKLPKEVSHLILPIDFIEDIRIAYAAADIVIARAGALTISELAIRKKPTIFVPSPNVANDHQFKNVEALLEKDAALLIKDKDAVKYLIDEAIYLSQDLKVQKILSHNISLFGFPNATDDMVDIIETIPYDLNNVSTSKVKERFKYIYLIGIGGIGMSALARWFLKLKFQVLGYDKSSTFLTSKLKEEGISIGFEDGIRFIPREVLDNPNKTLVIYTPAIPKDNEILNHMRNLGAATYKRSSVLGKLSEETFTIAVAGTHGKTSTSAMISHILFKTKQSLRAFVGGILKGYDSNFIFRKGKIKDTVTVVEADEFDRSFLKLSPDIEIITSSDPDHLDIYKNNKGILEGFRTFSNLLPENGKLIIQQNACKKLFKNISPELDDKIINYDIQSAEVHAENISFNNKFMNFDYVRPDVNIRNIKLPIYGYHNIENAVAAITACSLLGLKLEDIKSALETFPGIKRRFEYIIRNRDLIFIDDYAHHPQEIIMLLSSIRDMYPQNKITVVFQPHLFSRTKDFAKEFAQSLLIADKIYLLPIYPARETPMKGVTSKIIFSKMKARNKQKTLCEKEEIIDLLIKDKPEILVTIGAGDIDKLVIPIKKTFLK